MNKLIIAGIVIVIIIIIGIVSVSLSDTAEQNNEDNKIDETSPLEVVEEPTSGRNLEVFLEETVGLTTSP